MTYLAWPSLLVLTIAAAGCDPSSSESAAGQSFESTGAVESGSDASSGTTMPPMEDTSSGDSSGSESGSSTGAPAPAPFEPPEDCYSSEDCGYSCTGQSPLPYWYECGGAICTVGVEPEAQDVRCAIEALGDQTPGRITIEILEVPKDWKEGFTAENVHFQISADGLVARGHEVERYDTKVLPSYDTELAPLARPDAPDHPVWAECLEPEPDLQCLLESADIFAEECVDEAFEPCAEE